MLASINCLVLLLRVLEAEARKFEHHDAHGPAKVKRRGYNDITDHGITIRSPEICAIVQTQSHPKPKTKKAPFHDHVNPVDFSWEP